MAVSDHPLQPVGDQSFWRAHYARFRDHTPTPFARYCMESVFRPDDMVVELGCGNGRDGLAIAPAVARYVGYDTCEVATADFRAAAASLGLEPGRVDVRTEDATRATFEWGSGRVVVYSRFSLHAMSDEAQALLLDNLAATRTPWLFAAEVRTIHDSLYGVGERVGRHAFRTDHVRRFLDPQEFVRHLPTRFALRYFEVARGFAKYGDQDPPVMRIVFSSDG